MQFDPFPVFNNDVGITILSLLPQKSLLKFRSVSKSWRHTIDSPVLRELHVENQLYKNFRRNDDDQAFLRLIMSDFIWKLSVRLVDSQMWCHDFSSYQDFFRNHVGCEFLGFCGPIHGLICLYKNYIGDSIALCNPSLGEIKILPPPATPLPLYIRNVGFGYDDLKKDYKVVQMWYRPSERSTLVEVYSRRENKWRVIASHPLHRNLLIANTIRRLRPWTSSGVVHWYGWKWMMGANDEVSKYCVIISFNVRSEEFNLIVIPFIEHWSKIDVVAKEDSILLFARFSLLSFNKISGVDIWEYKREWIKMVRLAPLDEITSWMSDGLVFKIVSDSKLVIYDSCTEKEVECIDLKFPFLHKKEERKIEYVGSFISP